MKWRAYLVVLCALLSVGCASAGGPASAGAGAPTTSPNLLTGDEIRETRAANLFEALRALRPTWLRGRGPSSMVGNRTPQPIVYLQGIRHGLVDTLAGMNVDRVRQVSFLEGIDASARYGLGHDAGVILVDLFRDR